MAFKMNKKNVNFGEGTGSSPKKFIGAAMGMFGGSFGQNQKIMDMQKRSLDKRYQQMSDKIGEDKARKFMKATSGYDPAPTAGAQGAVVGDPETQDAGDPNLEAKKAAKGGGGIFGGIGKAVRGDGSATGSGNLKDRLRSILQELENKD
tara:strand:+ start:511 stop:957 length:447 start_codon:yes stop_codon:yes gene_type:complete